MAAGRVDAYIMDLGSGSEVTMRRVGGERSGRRTI